MAADCTPFRINARIWFFALPWMAALSASALAAGCAGGTDESAQSPPHGQAGSGGSAGAHGDASLDATHDGPDALSEVIPETSSDVVDAPDEAKDVYEAGDAGPDADASDGHPGDAADAWDAVSEADACVPSPEVCDGIDNNCDGKADEGCTCTQGDTQPCYTGAPGTQGVGLCKGGTQTCDAAGTWGACDGEVTPASEACNGKDDNCDSVVDNGDINVLCGPNPPHGSWLCIQSTCLLGTCEQGWIQYPPSTPANGCNCQIDSSEANNTCGVATNAGTVSDTGGGNLTLQGTLSSAVDVDVYSFQAVDNNEGTTNSFHVSIAFTGPSPNSEFAMDVMHGPPCSDTPSGAMTGITSYDWCVNGTDNGNPPTGESVCGQQGSIHCNDNSTTYWVRVYRRVGVPGSCTSYSIAVSANAGPCADMAAKCE